MWHVEFIGEKRSANKVITRRVEEKKRIRRTRLCWEDSVIVEVPENESVIER